ncbi:hypothetical protein BJ508DRAFT_305114 [Ascobolus immersus RN42]|uniref:Uncharacterized protein n=1 Tax=Ascobolus immersus RN42 TaxID=1160509 RepID=A0A3N4IAJ0_ASCIM|nr:hypothetical protein BJ508DRAFT_305114 [Ascobolus immersus RN42]
MQPTSTETSDSSSSCSAGDGCGAGHIRKLPLMFDEMIKEEEVDEELDLRPALIPPQLAEFFATCELHCKMVPYDRVLGNSLLDESLERTGCSGFMVMMYKNDIEFDSEFLYQLWRQYAILYLNRDGRVCLYLDDEFETTYDLKWTYTERCYLQTIRVSNCLFTFSLFKSSLAFGPYYMCKPPVPPPKCVICLV